MIRNRFCWMVAAVSCFLLPFSCVQEEDGVDVPEHGQGMSLQLKVQAGADNTGTAPTSEESSIHTLRVYAFADIPNDPKDGRLVGYYYTNQELQASHSFDMNITFYEKGEQDVNFYVVANEAAMITAGPGGPQPLSENTTEQELNDYSFTALPLPSDIKNAGLPMYDKQTQKTLAFDAAGAPNADPISFSLKRPMGKLGVFAAKAEGELGVLKVTGLRMLASGTRTRNYLMPKTEDELKQDPGITGDLPLSVVESNVESVLPEGITLEERTNPKNYTAVLNEPFYPFENPWGSTDWSAPGDKDGNVLQVDYMFDGKPFSNRVYMPKIERNKYYVVCCLMHNNGKITVDYVVADWDKETWELDFAYPTYSNPILPADETIKPSTETNQYPQPTVWFNNDPANPEAGTYTFKFSMTGPKGQEWTPTLTNNPGAFDIEVLQGDQPLEGPSYKASPDPYYIRIKASEAGNVNEEVSLAIGYTPSWDPSSSRMLLINGLTGQLKWEGSTYAETVEIKQIERPN